MARRVFFSFKYEDVSRAMVVRNCGITAGEQITGFIDHADFEAVKRRGDNAIRNWIDGQLDGSSVTVVLVGALTCTSRWVRYEIEQSKLRKNGLIGIDISQINDFNGQTSNCCGSIPAGYPFYGWYRDDGFKNLGNWVEAAAKAAGR
jgi:hypothetical protein